MSLPLAEQFKTANEQEKGVVHFVKGLSGIVPVLKSFCDSCSFSRVMLATMSPAVNAVVEKAFLDAGVEVLRTSSLDGNAASVISSAQVGITEASFGIAETGSVVQITTSDADRLTPIMCWTHICILRCANIVPKLCDAAPRLRDAFKAFDGHCAASFITGPSRTGDIEFKLVMGVHGSQQTHTIVVMNPDAA